MNPFMVYLLMQADNFCTATLIISILSGLVFLLLAITVILVRDGLNQYAIDNKTSDWRQWVLLKRSVKATGLIFALSMFTATVMPSTKTIAAMIVLPKITSPAAMQKIGQEGIELLELTKDAIRSLSAKPDKDSSHE